MSEIERLRAWMEANQYTVATLALAVGMSREGLNMIFWRKNVSPGFKLRFIQKFGLNVAEQVFSTQQAESEPCPA